VVLSTRVDPPLPLARLRASGELTEVRIADLGFTDAEAASLLRDAMEVAEAQGVRLDPLTGVAYIALGRSTARHGRLAEAEHLLDQALQVLPADSYAVQNAQALVELAGVRHARGDTDGAQAAIERARQLITAFADPGMLDSLLDRTERALGRPSRWRPSVAAALTTFSPTLPRSHGPRAPGTTSSSRAGSGPEQLELACPSDRIAAAHDA